ncbi:MAG: hypothetical protein JWN81_1653 [Solirubrobacterales bacterium]|jgi:hypothetical protein|nr:hypothetical protein [Solirubrobacterales bacterium]
MNRRQRTGKAASTMLVILLAGLLLVACGESSKGTSTSAAGASSSTPSTEASKAPTTSSTFNPALEDRLAAFRECMSRNGIHLPQTKPGQSVQVPSGVSHSRYEIASLKCRNELGSVAPPAAASKPITPHGRQALIKFVECMRANGIKLPKPTPSRPLYYPGGLNLASPQFAAAERKCFPLMH